MDIQLDKINKLRELQRQLTQLKKDELALRKSVADDILGKAKIAGQKTVHIGDLEVVATRPQKLVYDSDYLMEFADDDSIPGVVSIKYSTTLSKLKYVSDDHEIWREMYVDVSDTPTVSVKEK